jgi:hypothetical protein
VTGDVNEDASSGTYEEQYDRQEVSERGRKSDIAGGWNGRAHDLAGKGGIRATCNGGEEDLWRASLVFDRSGRGDVTYQGSDSILGMATHTPFAVSVSRAQATSRQSAPRNSTIGDQRELVGTLDDAIRRRQETVGAIISERTDYRQGNR